MMTAIETHQLPGAQLRLSTRLEWTLHSGVQVDPIIPAPHARVNASSNHNGKWAVLYAPTSYDERDTDGRNLAGQLEMAREYALGKGYRIVAELAEDDKGASGASFELPKLGEGLEMAEAGESKC